MSSLLLVRAPGKRSPFRRSVRDEKDEAIKLLVFEPGIPVLCEGDDLAAVANDVGRAIFICEQDGTDPIRINILYDETSAFVEAAAGRELKLEGKRKMHVKRQGEDVDPSVDVHLDDDILAILDEPENVKALGGEVTPESIAQYVASGKKLVDLTGIGKVKADKIAKVLGLNE
ncbi:hypothetical protein LOC67_23395 [Stieleria sp. JC731]|uniref:hypothetical protein n=1 Tax=Pirellulaceae TaxID=2691357 RepID=UPI001E5C9F83|nr:hypothetical protein [Stieleria sp. JC731]MCC9603505.1 hypothetical protein [Stieleria sp. JC731]